MKRKLVKRMLKLYLQHKFVDFIPHVVNEGVIYISMENAIAVHKCPCGCGQEVITPFSPTDWKLIYNGKSITLNPSIGNWSFDCRSHYWIRKSRIQWSRNWSQAEVERNRWYDQAIKLKYYKQQTETNALPDQILIDS